MNIKPEFKEWLDFKLSEEGIESVFIDYSSFEDEITDTVARVYIDNYIQAHKNLVNYLKEQGFEVYE